MRKLEEKIVVANAHAELLDFFAMCSDEDERSTPAGSQQKSPLEKHGRRNTNEF